MVPGGPHAVVPVHRTSTTVNLVGGTSHDMNPPRRSLVPGGPRSADFVQEGLSLGLATISTARAMITSALRSWLEALARAPLEWTGLEPVVGAGAYRFSGRNVLVRFSKSNQYRGGPKPVADANANEALLPIVGRPPSGEVSRLPFQRRSPPIRESIT